MKTQLSGLAPLLAALLLALALAAAPASAARRLQAAPAGESISPSEGWVDGRATWFDHPHTGSCGYGWLDGYAFGVDAVAAMPDTAPDYNSSCGRCYQVRCRGIQAISADGTVNLDRRDACSDTSKSIVIKIVDTCPCNGNEKWCCGDMPHLDLSAGAFARLAPQGKGIIGLQYRPVPCSMASAPSEAAVPQQDWAYLKQSVAMAAGPAVFVDGEPGLGWEKTVYGDALRSMYTYNSSVVSFAGGEEKALCGDFQMYGGLDFHTQANRTSMFQDAQSVEFWVQSQGGVPDFHFRLGHILGGQCWKEQRLQEAVAKATVTQAGWTKLSFGINEFDCTHEVSPADINRVQWECKSPSGCKVCVKDVRVVRSDTPAGAPYKSSGGGK